MPGVQSSADNTDALLWSFRFPASFGPNGDMAGLKWKHGGPSDADGNTRGNEPESYSLSLRKANRRYRTRKNREPSWWASCFRSEPGRTSDFVGQADSTATACPPPSALDRMRSWVPTLSRWETAVGRRPRDLVRCTGQCKLQAWEGRRMAVFTECRDVVSEKPNLNAASQRSRLANVRIAQGPVTDENDWTWLPCDTTIQHRLTPFPEHTRSIYPHVTQSDEG